MICKPDQSGGNSEERLSILTAKKKQLKVSFKLCFAKVASSRVYRNMAMCKVSRQSPGRQNNKNATIKTKE
jgi:hypothetical protein